MTGIFDPYNIDLDQIRHNNTLSQFRWTDEIMNAINKEVVGIGQQSMDDIIAILNGRQLGTAPQWALNIIAKWVGSSTSTLVDIQARIFKNHIKYGSVGEVITFAKLALGIDISLRHVSSYDWEIFVPDEVSLDTMRLLLHSETTDKYDDAYYLPMPIVRRLVGIKIHVDNAFRVDVIDRGVDMGHATVGFYITL